MNEYFERKRKADYVRSIALQRLLKRIGCSRDKYDKAKWHTPRGEISITGPKFMNWTLSIGGGGAIDLCMHLLSYNFKTSVDWLYENFSPINIGESTNRRSLNVELPFVPKLILPQKDNTKLPEN